MSVTSIPARPSPKWQRAAFSLIGTALLTGLPVTAVVASPPPSPTASPSADIAEGDAVEMPKMRAWTWVVADADTGDVLGGRDWHWKLPPASTLKTLTALSMVKRLQLDSPYRVQKSDTAAEGSRVGLKAGSTYRVRDLFDGMLMPSGNDAATAIASAYGGIKATTEAMNREAQRIGATDTKAVNSSGLDEPGQVSTAYDLALIFRESLKNPQLRDIYQQHHVDFPDGEPSVAGAERKTYRIWTENRLILNYHAGALGGKTGFTSQAGRTYVGAMERDGRTLIVAVMRSAESTERAVTRLFDWGFANHDKLRPVDRLADSQPDDELSPVAAVNYDELGGTGATGSAVPASASGGVSGPLFAIIIASAAGLGALIWRRRRKIERSGELRSRRPSSVDLRDRDDAPHV